MKNLKYILILIIALAACFSQAETIEVDPETGSKIIRDITPPRYIYHWTSLETLQIISENKNFSDPWTIFGNLTEGIGSQFLFRWPQFKKSVHGGLFTWTHPILGMQGGDHERYGQYLVRIEIDAKQARVARVETGPHTTAYSSDSTPDFRSKADFTNIDLVFNGYEWLLLNPRAILNFTADIDVLRPTLLTELALLQDPRHRYQKSDIHWYDIKEDRFRHTHLNHAIKTVNHLLEIPADMIPSYFRRNSQGAPIDRQNISLERSKEIAKEYEQKKRGLYAQEMRKRNIEELKQKIFVLDSMIDCKASCLYDSFKSRLDLYVLENPESRSLTDLLNQALTKSYMPTSIYDSEVLRMRTRLQQDPFDPFKGLIDILLSNTKNPAYITHFFKLATRLGFMEQLKTTFAEGGLNPYAEKNSLFDVLHPSISEAAIAPKKRAPKIQRLRCESILLF